MSLLLSTLETTIVSTSLVSIVSALNYFDQSGWVVTSYFLNYAGMFITHLVRSLNEALTHHGTIIGFLIIYAKLSDIFGCKLMLLCALTLFTIFSIACGLADSMLLLYAQPSTLSPLTSQCPDHYAIHQDHLPCLPRSRWLRHLRVIYDHGTSNGSARQICHLYCDCHVRFRLF